MATYRTLDPEIGRWWGVDPKADGNADYNPFNSMLNNPVSNVDPNGDNPFIIGAAIGLVANGISNTLQGNDFFKGGLKAAFFGAIGGGISSGIGSLAQGLADKGWNALSVGAFQAGAHAVSGSALSALQGGSFWSGAAAGGISSAVGSGISALGGGDFAQWLGGGLAGGIGSWIAGGGFWSGVSQGLITGGLNHAAEDIEYKINMSKASDQQIIDKFKHALAVKASEFNQSKIYTPLNLEDYFKNFPELSGTHGNYSGEMDEVPIELEIPVRSYNRTSLNWGGPGWQNEFQHVSGQYRTTYIYSKYGSNQYPLWSISFPSSLESFIRVIPGIL